jgi:endo-1,4-beta-xylanase
MESWMKNSFLIKIALASLLICFGCSNNNLAGAAGLPTETTSVTEPTLTEQIVETIPPAPTQVPTPAPTPTNLGQAEEPTAVPTETEVSGSATLRSRGEKKGIQMGIYLDWQWFGRQPDWEALAAKQFNLAVIADGLFWNGGEPQQGRYAFEPVMDNQVAFAQANGMDIVGHTLVFGQAPYLPKWLAQGNFSKEQMEGFLRNYIVAVMSRYKGTIHTYIVAQDAPLPEYMSTDVFYQKFGYDYIDLAFQIARETDPSATLIYNADDNETAGSPTSALTHQIVDRLKSKGLVDGVGFGMHIDASQPPDKAAVIAEMQSYGLPVHVTEIDVDLGNLYVSKEERYAKQAQIYGDMLSACVESGVCKSFSIWGIGDKFSWLMRNSAFADPAPFDNDLNPKPAYFSLLEALR